MLSIFYCNCQLVMVLCSPHHVSLTKNKKSHAVFHCTSQFLSSHPKLFSLFCKQKGFLSHWHGLFHRPFSNSFWKRAGEVKKNSINDLLIFFSILLHKSKTICSVMCAFVGISDWLSCNSMFAEYTVLLQNFCIINT